MSASSLRVTKIRVAKFGVSRLCAVLLAIGLALSACGSADRPTLDAEAPADADATSDASDEVSADSDAGVDSEAGTDEATAETETADDNRFPNVIEVNFEREGNGPYSFDVTISSPYDTPERYADAWRVVGLDGTVYGTRELTHDHQFEQPFTRSLAGVEIPDGVDELMVEARDSVNGWGGGTVDIRLDPNT